MVESDKKRFLSTDHSPVWKNKFFQEFEALCIASEGHRRGESVCWCKSNLMIKMRKFSSYGGLTVYIDLSTLK